MKMMVTQDDPQISAYSIGECIGTGQYGKVFRAVYKRTNTLVALKLVDLSCRSKQDVEALRDEIICHQKMSRHPNIVYCLDSFVTRKGTLKICDFGFAQLLRGSLGNKLTLTSVKGTPIYMAPELIQEEPYTHLVDLWALGIMLFELRTGKPPFYTTNIFKLIEMILKDPVVFPDKVSAETEFKDLVSNLLMKQPSARLDWPNLAMHPFIATAPKTTEEQDNTFSEKKGRPTTTDSGVDVASARKPSAAGRNKSLKPVWEAIDGLELPRDLADSGETAKLDKVLEERIVEPIEKLNWQLLLNQTQSQNKSWVLESDFLETTFKGICSMTTSLCVEELELSGYATLKQALLVLQRILIVIGFEVPVKFDFMSHIKILVSWTCSLVHGILQLETSLKYYSVNVFELLESTLQLLSESIQTSLRLCSHSSQTKKVLAPTLAKLLIQLYLPLLSRLLYSSVKSTQAGDSISSNITDIRNDKWLRVLKASLSATKFTFDCIHMIEVDGIQTVTRCLDDVVELSLFYTIYDFLNEFWDGSRQRVVILEAVLSVVKAMVVGGSVTWQMRLAPFLNNHCDTMELFQAWNKLLETVEKALLMNSGFGVRMLADLVVSGSCRSSTDAVLLVAVLGQNSQQIRDILQLDSRMTGELVELVSGENIWPAGLAMEVVWRHDLETGSLKLAVLKRLTNLDAAIDISKVSMDLRLLVTIIPVNQYQVLNEILSRLEDKIMEALSENSSIDSMLSTNLNWVDDLAIASVKLAEHNFKLAKQILSCLIQSGYKVQVSVALIFSQLWTFHLKESHLHAVLHCQCKMLEYYLVAPQAFISHFPHHFAEVNSYHISNMKFAIIDNLAQNLIMHSLEKMDDNDQNIIQAVETVGFSLSMLSSSTLDLAISFLARVVLTNHNKPAVLQQVIETLLTNTKAFGPVFWERILVNSTPSQQWNGLICIESVLYAVAETTAAPDFITAVETSIQKILHSGSSNVRLKASLLSAEFQVKN